MNSTPVIGIPHPRILNSIATIFPIVSLMLCRFFYKFFNHEKPGRLRTISETVNAFPENRMFPVFMGIEGVLLFFLFTIRNGHLKERSLKSHEINMFGRLSLPILSFLPIIITIGLWLESSISLADNSFWHITSAAVFFYSIILYFYLSDYIAKKVGFRICTISRICKHFSLIFFIAYQILINSYNKTYYNIGVVCQYIASASVFSKIFFMQFDVPRHSIFVQKLQ